MSEVNKNVIKFPSTNKKNTLVGYIYSSNDIVPKAVLMISHGMCEYIERYDDFANYMVQNNFIVCGYDHLGHGKSSDEEGGCDGYFGENDGIITTLDDMKCFYNDIKARYPDLPFVLLGHSMGSFFSRLYVAKNKNDIDAFIISGTAGPNPMGAPGIFLTKMIKNAKGDKHRSAFIHNLVFKQYTSKLQNPKTQYDWLSRDEQIVYNYSVDKKCTYVFTVNGFLTLFNVLQLSNSQKTIDNTNKNMPMLVISGKEDAVGNYGKGPRYLYNELKNKGAKNIELKLYDDARHEMLNELNKEEAYKYILNWCNINLQNKKEN